MCFCKLRAGRDQSLHKFHAVPAHPAARHADTVSDLLPVAPTRRDQMIVLHGAAFVNVRIAGVGFLCPLIVGSNGLGSTALPLCKS